MPELPEVETVRLGLQKLLVGHRILAVTSTWPKSFDATTAAVATHLIGGQVSGVERRAKLLIINLDSDWCLAVHLKMTGQLVFVDPAAGERFGAGHPNESLVGHLPDRTTRVRFDLGSAQLFFNDQRKFGWIKLMPREDLPSLPFFKGLGPEPLDDQFTAAEMQARLGRRGRSRIKAALLDQTVIAGIGNIYADESLWAAKIHPETPVSAIKAAQIVELHQGLQTILRLSLEHGGSSDRNYIDAEGKRGTYLRFANVYHRDGQPCRRCGTTIIKLRVAGRGTHICPQCQVDS